MFDKKMVIIVFFIFICAFSVNASEYVYSWTDENGVRIFSDKPPVTGVKNLQKYEKIVDSGQGQETISKQSDQNASQNYSDDDLNTEEKDVEESDSDEPKEETSPEIERLEKEIEKIKSRGLGPKYSQGMKDNQIEIIKKKIEKLKDAP